MYRKARNQQKVQWQPDAVFKMHYQVTLEDRRELGIFRNYKARSWYYQDEH